MTHLLLAVIYLSFVSLGLPDGLLGAAWPTIYPRFGVPVSWAGGIFMIISAGTILSSLLSDRLTRSYGTGRVTAASVAMTAAALWGFSVSGSFWALCLWAVPYGLGAGSVDASLNNYVALHYTSRHMSWLHCMWGIGAATGPYVMGWVLSGGGLWNSGYRMVGLMQAALTAVLVVSLRLWKQPGGVSSAEKAGALSLRQVVSLPGAKEIMAAFFCYCALEQTTGLWASSYLTLHRGVSRETAAAFGSLFYVGITAGRALNGFLTLKYTDTRLIRMGQSVIIVGISLMLLPMGEEMCLAGLILIGLGCAPIYPCIIHSTPEHFGESRSQALIGVQMASAYAGNLLMPPLYGLMAEHISSALLPVYLFTILILMIVMHEKMLKGVKHYA